tara:strand:- start:483 stop:812 length:330 start_codon:yes stop_codon:yes gene_type:complete
MSSTDSPELCVIVKNAPYNSTVDDIVHHLLLHGCDPIHHCRTHRTKDGLSIFFIYFYSPISAIHTVFTLNCISFYNRNLILSMHKDSKNMLVNILWPNETNKKTEVNLI